MAYLDVAATTSARLQILDDVANQDVEMQSVQNDVIYIVLDTNILLHHLKIVKNFVEDIAFSGVPITVICPGAVLNELDFQKKQSDLGRLARNATDWMMKEVTRKDLAQPIVKGQAQRETCKPSRNWKIRTRGEQTSNDDIIVDCCQYYKSKAPVILYTGDKNLCLKCDQEGLSFISPPPPDQYSSLDLVKCIQGMLPEYDMILDKIVRNYDGIVRNKEGNQSNGMMVDEDVYVSIPQATVVHCQVIERFRLLLRELVQRAGGEELAKLGKSKNGGGGSISKYAPLWQQKDLPVDQWEIGDYLEYLQGKKNIKYKKPDPPLERFLRSPYTGNGALSGVEWSANAWRAAASNLRQLGETWEDKNIVRDIILLEQYIEAEYSAS